jgi:outer membrane receptor protein involved in Fe transport
MAGAASNQGRCWSNRGLIGLAPSSMFPLYRLVREPRTGAWLAPGRCVKKAHLISPETRLAKVGYRKTDRSSPKKPQSPSVGQRCRRHAVVSAGIWLLLFSLLSISVSAFADNKDKDAKSGAAAGSREVLRGMVRDESGSVIAGAEVHLRGDGVDRVEHTNAEGAFEFRDFVASKALITVTAAGFAPLERAWVLSNANGDPLQLVLRPATILEQTVVVATRTPLAAGEASASVETVTPEELRSTAALTLDNVLGQVAGFNLFRRSSSRTANPTTQGVSLRGTGGSGASRAVVLDDGIPIEDAFGGWVQWSRVPRAAVERVEVVEGGVSDLYGTNGLGGAISIVRRPATTSALTVETSYGNERTPDATVAGSIRAGDWVASGGGEVFATNGFILVQPGQRGAVDVPADSEHRTGDATLERLFANSSRIFVRGSVFGEQRGNGTPLQVNSTALRQLATGVDWHSDRAGNFGLRVHGDEQRFSQTFSAVAVDRNSESLTNSQFVPSTETGASAQWSRALGGRNVLVGGVDAHDVRGDTRETVFVAGTAVRATDAGGHQRDVGVFVEDMFRASERLLVTASLRYDKWRNFDPVSRTTALATGATTLVPVTGQSEGAFSPRVGLNYKVTEHVSVNASGYRAFRGPTLNELYRSFRVGNVVTQANAALRAERATGAETGAAVRAWSDRLVVRGTVFWTEINRPVSNVTLSTTAALVTRQRQNLGQIVSKGFEVSTEMRVRKRITVNAGYQLADARVTDFPADRTIEGLFVPQVPRQQFTLQTTYAGAKYTFAVQGRAVGVQYDDDQNLLPLERFFALDAFASRTFRRRTEVFVALENVLDQRCEVARTPVLTVGPPVLVRVGVRGRW